MYTNIPPIYKIYSYVVLIIYFANLIIQRRLFTFGRFTSKSRIGYSLDLVSAAGKGPNEETFTELISHPQFELT